MASELYDGIIAPQGGLYQPGPQVVMPNAGRVTAEGLAVRPVQTVAIDNYGNPILAQQKANAVAQALSVGGGGRSMAGARGDVAAALSGIPTANGTLVAGKDQSRLPSNAFGYGENGMTGGWTPAQIARAPSQALAAIDAISPTPSVGLPRSRPNIEGNPGTLIPTRAPDGGVFGIPMSKGMQQIIATDPRYAAQRGGPVPSRGALPITVRGGNRTQQALAQVAVATRPAPAPVAQYQSNGVANPAYRDYSGVRQSEGGGGAPSAPSGSFTDSLGGTYYDRHL